MEQISGSEAALFLLFLSANYKWDNQNYCLQGELTDESEQLILKCVNRLSFFEDVSSQQMLEKAIAKWDKLIRGSISTDDALDQITDIIYKQEFNDIYSLFYLCCKIVLINPDYSTPEEKGGYFDLLEEKLYLKSDMASIITTMSYTEAILY